MGIFKRLFGTKEIEGATYLPDGMMFHPTEETEKNEIWMRLSVSRKGDNVCIEMHGLEKVNVCLASFLTKGVSYAQEKYNEYKQSPKDIEPIEEPKSDTRTKRESQRPSKREIEEMRAWANAYQEKKGGKR